VGRQLHGRSDRAPTSLPGSPGRNPTGRGRAPGVRTTTTAGWRLASGPRGSRRALLSDRRRQRPTASESVASRPASATARGASTKPPRSISINSRIPSRASMTAACSNINRDASSTQRSSAAATMVASTAPISRRGNRRVSRTAHIARTVFAHRAVGQTAVEPPPHQEHAHPEAQAEPSGSILAPDTARSFDEWIIGPAAGGRPLTPRLGCASPLRYERNRFSSAGRTNRQVRSSRLAGSSARWGGGRRSRPADAAGQRPRSRSSLRRG
jgi:hypothetical protein